MKKYFLPIFVGVLLFGDTSLCAEAPDTAWTRKFKEMKIGYSVQQTQDGGYIITGSINTSESPQGMPLLKVDSLGNKEWYKTFGGKSCGYSVQQTQDDGYVMTGAVTGDVGLIKTDPLGNKEWDKTFGGTESEEGKSVQQTQDGGYIITGYTKSYGAGEYDVWLIKTDSLGEKEWDKTFGTGGYEGGKCVQQIQDGGYIITGWIDFDASGPDVWLIKTDSLGNKEWDKTFGGTNGDAGKCVQQTSDDGYVITGETRSYGEPTGDVWLIKTDSLGDKEWDKTFGCGGMGTDIGYSVQQTQDGGYVIAGENAGGILWILKTDTSGDTLWTKILGNPDGYHIGWCVQQTTDGGYIISGETSPIVPPVRELWLIKLEPDAGTEEGKLSLPNEFLLSQNSSNPFSNSTEIKFGLPEDSNVNISIYNLLGEKVATLIDEPRNAGCYTTRWDATDNSGEKLATGVYFSKLSAKSQGKTHTKTLKICLMR